MTDDDLTRKPDGWYPKWEAEHMSVSEQRALMPRR